MYKNEPLNINDSLNRIATLIERVETKSFIINESVGGLSSLLAKVAVEIGTELDARFASMANVFKKVNLDFAGDYSMKGLLHAIDTVEYSGKKFSSTQIGALYQAFEPSLLSQGTSKTTVTAFRKNLVTYFEGSFIKPIAKGAIAKNEGIDKIKARLLKIGFSDVDANIIAAKVEHEKAAIGGAANNAAAGAGQAATVALPKIQVETENAIYQAASAIGLKAENKSVQAAVTTWKQYQNMSADQLVNKIGELEAAARSIKNARTKSQVDIALSYAKRFLSPFAKKPFKMIGGGIAIVTLLTVAGMAINAWVYDEPFAEAASEKVTSTVISVTNGAKTAIRNQQQRLKTEDPLFAGVLGKIKEKYPCLFDENNERVELVSGDTYRAYYEDANGKLASDDFVYNKNTGIATWVANGGKDIVKC